MMGVIHLYTTMVLSFIDISRIVSLDQKVSPLLKINQREIEELLITSNSKLDAIVHYAYNLADKVERSRTHKYTSYLDSAIVIMERAVELNDQNIDYKIFLSRLYLWQGNLGRVIELCDEVLEVRGFDFLALHFRGISLLQDNKFVEGIRDLECLNNIDPHHGLLAWNLANAYFHNNDFEDGWRVFNKANEVIGIDYSEIPRWKGETLIGKTIVLTQYNSSGGGDDIMFAHMIPDVIEAAENCYIEVDERSAPLYLRSFKDANIFLYGQPNWNSMDKVDFQVMMPQLGSILRKTTDDFGSTSGYLEADNKKVKFWKSQLNDIAGEKLKVGVCWRSMISIGLTGSFSSKIEDWGPILSTPGIAFFDLQYDDSEEERRTAETLYGIKIHRFHNIDMMTDFDNLAALCLSLDLVVSMVTTLSIIANSVGATVWELRPQSTALCMSGLPWFPKRKTYQRDWREPWSNTIEQVSKDLEYISSNE